jgi:hypothetical protein
MDADQVVLPCWFVHLVCTRSVFGKIPPQRSDLYRAKCILWKVVPG